MLAYQTIAAGDLVLRPPRPQDGPDLLAAGLPAAGINPDLDPAAAGPVDVLSWIADALTAPERREWVVEESGRIAGGCRLSRLSTVDRSAGIGYWTAPWARGRGVATRACSALTDWAFAGGLGRLEALARPDNPLAHRVAIAAGYRHEGRRRGAEYGRDGHRYDLTVWARLHTDPPGPSPRLLPDLPGGRLTDGVVELRPLGPADTADVVALRALPEVAATSFGDTEVARICAEAEGEWLAGRAARLTIRDGATGALAGEIGMFQLDPTGQAMLGADLFPAFRGKGFATRAVRLIADWAFGTVGLARLIAGTTPDNVASQAVLERAGFRREGYQRARLPGPAGTRLDDVLYALLPS
jgi:RimJ/RimL family protein N-acetyltransferase